ncbi:cupin domain-containing protein [Nocardia sp. NPDC051570]|uniref:cupin domain-containing protein n=1 Tax=Nocardia sp. NPDC051570 TaxID=3364324 RepID=UPI0037BA9342
MIVSSIRDGLTTTFDDELGEAVFRCLGRRGMLYSECESFDYVRLAPGAGLDGRGRDEVEEAWFVLSGEGEIRDEAGFSIQVQQGDLILCADATSGHWHNTANAPLEMLFIALMPASISQLLPIRTPMS